MMIPYPLVTQDRRFKHMSDTSIVDLSKKPLLH